MIFSRSLNQCNKDEIIKINNRYKDTLLKIENFRNIYHSFDLTYLNKLEDVYKRVRYNDIIKAKYRYEMQILEKKNISEFRKSNPIELKEIAIDIPAHLQKIRVENMIYKELKRMVPLKISKREYKEFEQEFGI